MFLTDGFGVLGLLESSNASGHLALGRFNRISSGIYKISEE